MKHFFVLAAVILSLLIGVTSCGRKEISCYDDLPYIYTDTLINVYSQQFHNLEMIGGWGYIPSGYKGIFIYHATQDEFVAWERCCPCHPKHRNAKVFYDGGFLLHDSLCGSEFIVTNGMPTQSSSTPCPLLSFGVSLDKSTGMLHIYNSK